MILSTVSHSEEELSEEQLVVACSIFEEGQVPVPTQALIDTGASGYAFIDATFARSHGFLLTPLRTPRHLQVIDGRPVESGAITHIVKLALNIQGHLEYAPFLVTKLGHYPIVMGLPWMRHHDLVLRPRQNQIIFSSPSCVRQCSVSRQPVTAQGITSKMSPPRAPIHVAALKAFQFTRLLRKGRGMVFCASLRAIDAALENPADPLAHVPLEHHGFSRLFLKSAANILSPHRPHDHEITLENGKSPPFGPIYSMTEAELLALQEYIRENMANGFISASESPAGAPILFVKKSDGSLRLCVDYRKLNVITVKNRHPLPLFSKTLMNLSKAKFLTKLDLRSGYHQIRIKEGDEWKTAFRTRLGHYQYNVMPFGLTNAPATFQHWINDVLRPRLDDFCTAYLDDILIYSDNLEQHREHVRKILTLLEQNRVHLNPEKCKFHVRETRYLGMILSPAGISMHPKKVNTIQE